MSSPKGSPIGSPRTLSWDDDDDHVEPWDSELIPGCRERCVTRVNGLEMHLLEAGNRDDDLVVLLHGFPEGAFSWRHQLLALGAAGFYCVAPQQRGYPWTKGHDPHDVSQYVLGNLVADIIALVRRLGKDEAFIVGHDWGSIIAQTCALLRPDIFHAVALLSVPVLPVPETPGDPLKLAPDGFRYYQEYYISGEAEQDSEADLERFLLNLFWGMSSDGVVALSSRQPFQGYHCSGSLPCLLWEGKTLSMTQAIDATGLRPPAPSKLSWLSERDFEVFRKSFAETPGGLAGPLNWFRNSGPANFDSIQKLLIGKEIDVPVLFIAGEKDKVAEMRHHAREHTMSLPCLWRCATVPGAGHFVQQEGHVIVNELLIRFLWEMRDANHRVDEVEEQNLGSPISKLSEPDELKLRQISKL